MNCLLLPKNWQDNVSGQLINRTDARLQAVLTDDKQVAHIRQVLKSQVGDTLQIGALGGMLGTGTICTLTETMVGLSNVQLTQNPPDKLDLTVILALPRPKVLRRLIMDMTAIGVQRIVLVNSVRTQKSYWQSPLLSRIDEFVLEGLQQGVDTIAPEILYRQRFKPFVEDELSEWLNNKSQIAIVAHPYTKMSFFECTIQQGIPQILCIGAEGGWVDYEVALMQAQGCYIASLGQRILRTEAVVNVLCGQVLANAKDSYS
ncbi:16S rRNA (uracil(1498)-N(3))-methyltransferase [Psychrobacter sp. I-STPA6b]|uniref:16S rRNA (uracil(1498)-N(3))-methyltransferase n=1 Tax=Psychrobacter sp. I-STPA6b TaxID=2585718 RepID=UPI001D0C5263|nr:16S rRNA (uracil(1498)-N(3))-methyltransferase [Psychrobacter sp. I-STPA6b]